MKGQAAKARCVAQQVACGERDEVFAGALATCSCPHTVGTGGERSQVHRIVRHHRIVRALTNRRAPCSHSAGWDRPARPGTLVETCTVRNAQSVEALGENLL